MSDIFTQPSILELWPISILPTRYRGVYEGCQWVAIPCDSGRTSHDPDMFGDDIEASCWWMLEENTKRVGMGETPNDALRDLIIKSVDGSLLISEEDQEVDLEEEVSTAVDDVLALVTSLYHTIQSGEQDSAGELHSSVACEWEERGDIMPILQVFSAFALKLAQSVATANDVGTLAVLQSMALALKSEE